MQLANPCLLDNDLLIMTKEMKVKNDEFTSSPRLEKIDPVGLKLKCENFDLGVFIRPS